MRYADPAIVDHPAGVAALVAEPHGAGHVDRRPGPSTGTDQTPPAPGGRVRHLAPTGTRTPAPTALDLHHLDHLEPLEPPVGALSGGCTCQVTRSAETAWPTTPQPAIPLRRAR